MTAEGLIVPRAQFVFTIGFHILWPAYSIGLSGLIVILKILWRRTRRPVYRDPLRFWIHLFALGFATGVASPSADSACGASFLLARGSLRCGILLRQRFAGAPIL